MVHMQAGITVGMCHIPLTHHPSTFASGEKRTELQELEPGLWVLVQVNMRTRAHAQDSPNDRSQDSAPSGYLYFGTVSIHASSATSVVQTKIMPAKSIHVSMSLSWLMQVQQHRAVG